MTYAPGPWVVVARDADGDDREWCTHLHANGDEANECAWRASDPDWTLCCVSIEYLDEFDPLAAMPCLHGLHHAECARCLRVLCVHVNRPETCERCTSVPDAEPTSPVDTPVLSTDTEDSSLVETV